MLSFSPVDRLKERCVLPSPKSSEELSTCFVLKTLDSMGPMHGFGIVLRIQQVSENLLLLNQGTPYPERLHW
jgi:hypothetical protein